MSWLDMARGNRRAAQSLIAEDPRSSVSRSYYAAYCAVTAGLVAAGARFPRGWGNPPHREVPGYITGRLRSVAPWSRRALARRLRWLRLIRVEADYDPAAHIDKRLARDALREVLSVFRALGVKTDEEG